MENLADKTQHEWDNYYHGKVEFEWFSKNISPEMFERAFGGTLSVKKGIRAKETDQEGTIYLSKVMVNGEMRKGDL